MNPLFLALGNLVWLPLAAASLLLCALLLRHPRAPFWVKSEGMAVGVALLLTAAICAAVIVAAARLGTANVHYSLSGLLIFVTFLLSLWIFWWVFEVGKRLQSADEGRSPFSRHSHGPERLSKQAPVAT